jgi:hypothetical protein
MKVIILLVVNEKQKGSGELSVLEKNTYTIETLLKCRRMCVRKSYFG